MVRGGKIGAGGGVHHEQETNLAFCPHFLTISEQLIANEAVSWQQTAVQIGRNLRVLLYTAFGVYDES